MDASVYTILKEQVDPFLAAINEEVSAISSEFLDLFAHTPAPDIQVPEGGQLDIYQVKSMPSINIGDKWQYQQGTRDLSQGKIKFKKMTISVRMDEDEKNRIEKLGEINTVIGKMIKAQQRDNFAYLQHIIEKWIGDPWSGATTDEDYDASFKGILMGSDVSTGGTISQPADLNSTAGTAENNSAIILSGSQKTANNIQAILADLMTGLIKVDAVTGKVYDWSKGPIYMLCHPQVLAILKAQKDLLNATTGELSKQSLYQDLVAAGVQPISYYWANSAYALADPVTTTLVFVSDPKQMFEILTIDPPEGEGWTDWKEEIITEEGKTRYTYEKHKKIEFGVLCNSVFIRTSATAGYFFKPEYRMTVTAYDNTA